MGRDIEIIKEVCSNFIEDVEVVKRDNKLTISGTLHFQSFYDFTKNSFFPFAENNNKASFINDSYKVEVTFRKNKIPSVVETGGRIKRYSFKKRSLSLSDLHYPYEIACLSSPDKLWLFSLERINTESVLEFFKSYVIQFFYAQSYYQKNNKWPWKNLEHGIIGLLEQYSTSPNFILHYIIHKRTKANLFPINSLEYRRIESLNAKLRSYKIRGHRRCICRSGKKFWNCHPEAFLGLSIFKENIRFFDKKYSSL